MRREPVINKSINGDCFIKFGLGDTNRFNALREHGGIPSFVPDFTDWVGMPERTVRLNGEIESWQKEVNSVTSHFVFLNERDIQVLKGFPYQALRARFAKFRPNALARTKAPICTHRRFALIVLSAPFTCFSDVPLKRFALAFMGAVHRTHRLRSNEGLATRSADMGNRSYATLVRAVAGAVDSRFPINMPLGREFSPALWAQAWLRAVARSLKASERTELKHTISAWFWSCFLTTLPTGERLDYRPTFRIFAGSFHTLILPRMAYAVRGFSYAN